jgi:hypothetical protein
MSRLTGKDALGLFEAYGAIYTPQEEISEEQIWEEVEAWVKSLVEEGNDLSEFTWEEVYEAYIAEVASKGGSADPYGATGAAKPAAKPQMKGLSIGKGGFNIGGKPVKPGMSPIFQRPGAKPASAPAAKPAPTAAARPSAAPAARPAATAAAKPAPTAAATPAAKTPNPLMQKTFGYQTGGAPDQVKSTATPAAAKPTPKPTPAATGSKKPGSVYSSFDMFDVVKGHLIDEGYADTEDAAIAIMANMSEEWKASIISKVAD